MGFDGSQSTMGYCRNGDIPTFKLYIESTGELIDLHPTNIEPWEDLLTSVVGQLNQSDPIQESFEFYYPYPNPFNPSTLIKFGIPDASVVKIIAYDINGRHVDTIINNSWGGGGYSWSENSVIQVAHDDYGAIVLSSASTAATESSKSCMVVTADSTITSFIPAGSSLPTESSLST